MSLFHLSIGLSVVRWSPNLPYAHKLTKLSDDVAFKVGSLVTQELGWCSKDWDISLPQKLSNGLQSLIGGHMCHDMFCKVVTKGQIAYHIWGSIQLNSCLNTDKSMCTNSKGVVTMMGCIWALAWVPWCWMHHSQLLITFCICTAILGHQNWSWSKYRVWSWRWCPASQWHPFMAATQWALGLQTSKLLPICQLVCGNGRGLLGRASASSALKA